MMPQTSSEAKLDLHVLIPFMFCTHSFHFLDVRQLPGLIEERFIRSPIIATLATASFRADRNAARVKLPLCDRKRARMNAHDKLMINAPVPARDRGIGAGGRSAI